MNELEAKKIVQIMSQMHLHCCKDCAEALTQYFIDAFPEYKKLAICEFYSIFPDMEKRLG